MPKKRVKFSENVVSDVFEFEKEYPHKMNHIKPSGVMKRSNARQSPQPNSNLDQINDKIDEHFINIERDETNDKNIDFTGCLLDNTSLNEPLDISNVSGQEDSTLSHDGDIKITPFNLNDEMEYGHFDGSGNFIFRKQQEDIQDNWFDSVNWDQVKQTPAAPKNVPEDVTPTEINNSLDVTDVYRQILDLLNDGEIILKAIIRFGKNKTQKDSLLKLTELANKLLNNGEVNIYDFSKVTIHQKLAKINLHGTDDEDANLEKAFDSVSSLLNRNPNIENAVHEIEAPLWEYKWENSNDATIYGPFSSEQMAEWKNNGFFQKSIFCRKVIATNSADLSPDFHSSDRIDFELYL